MIRLAALAATVAAAAAAYFTAAKVLRIGEADDAYGMVMRKLGKR